MRIVSCSMLIVIGQMTIRIWPMPIVSCPMLFSIGLTELHSSVTELWSSVTRPSKHSWIG